MTEQEIKDRLRQALKGAPQTILGIVRHVDKNSRTCDVDYEGVMLYGVRLQPITGSETGLTAFPKTGTQALIVRIEESDDYALLKALEYDSIELTIGSQSLVADQDGFVFNNGTVGSVKADKMVEWMAKVHADITAIKSTLGSLAGEAFFSIPFITMQTPSPQLADFVDDTLKH